MERGAGGGEEFKEPGPHPHTQITLELASNVTLLIQAGFPQKTSVNFVIVLFLLSLAQFLHLGVIPGLHLPRNLRILEAFPKVTLLPKCGNDIFITINWTVLNVYVPGLKSCKVSKFCQAWFCKGLSSFLRRTESFQLPLLLMEIKGVRHVPLDMFRSVALGRIDRDQK